MLTQTYVDQKKKKKKIGGLQSGTRYRLINGFQLKIFARHGFSSCLSFVWKWELEMRVQQTISSYIRLLFGWQHRPSIFVYQLVAASLHSCREISMQNLANIPRIGVSKWHLQCWRMCYSIHINAFWKMVLENKNAYTHKVASYFMKKLNINSWIFPFFLFKPLRHLIVSIPISCQPSSVFSFHISIEMGVSPPSFNTYFEMMRKSRKHAIF